MKLIKTVKYKVHTRDQLFELFRASSYFNEDQLTSSIDHMVDECHTCSCVISIIKSCCIIICLNQTIQKASPEMYDDLGIKTIRFWGIIKSLLGYDASLVTVIFKTENDYVKFLLMK